MTAALVRGMAFVSAVVLVVGCGGRETLERHDVELDTSDAPAEDTGADTGPGDDTADTDTSADPDSAADTTAVDTAEPPDTSPSDVDLGPRELRNGTPVRFGHVVDGDTLDVFVGDEAVKVYAVRLKGLSAPECNKSNVLTEHFGNRYQCTSDDELYGLAAWQALHDAVEGRSGVVTCDDVPVGAWCPTDPYDRYLAYIEIDGNDLATQLAWYGNGFSYTAFTASKRAEICAAEYAAQAAGRGIWAGRTVSQVMDGMSASTRDWYYGHHDQRCDDAIAGQ